MVTRERLLTAEEFWEIARLPENEGRRLELEDRVIIEMASSSPVNIVLAGIIAHFLNVHVLPRKLGFVTTPDGGFKLSTGTVRQPDVAFIAQSRMPELPAEFKIAPDLAVEIVSPSEDVLKKVKEYLASGTQIVWAVYPDERTIEVFKPDDPRWQTLGIDDTLDGGDVLPGFTLPVKYIFDALA